MTTDFALGAGDATLTGAMTTGSARGAGLATGGVETTTGFGGAGGVTAATGAGGALIVASLISETTLRTRPT